jgi:hypothetical protein
MIRRIVAMVGAVVVASTASVSAQTWDDRLFISVNGGAQAGTATSTSVSTPTIYGQTASVTATRTLDSKPYVEITAGRPLRGRFGAAVSFSARASKADAAVTSSIPDPIFFNRPRTVTGSIPDMVHNERWFALLATWFLPVGEKSDLLFFVGPAIVSVQHEGVTSVTVTEVAGAPSVSATLETTTKALAGYQVGADFRYMLTQRLGVGGFVGFTRATGSILPGNKLPLGGFRVGGGARLRF